ncbi:MAG: TfoX/Sxy family protein [Candidatus Dormibacterales bacterium]
MTPMAPGSMKMPKPSEEAKAAFSKLVPDEPAVTLRPMFGNLSAFVNGNMFCGLFGDDLFVRLPGPELEAVKKRGGRDFEPVAGHKMSGYVMVSDGWRSKSGPAVTLIKRALAVTREMPAKGPKKSAKSTKSAANPTPRTAAPAKARAGRR